MFEVVFYKDIDGSSDVENYIDNLRINKDKSKDSRINYNHIVLYVTLLGQNGFALTSNFLKHINDQIWELRPGKYRILFAYLDDIGFLLLTIFKKKQQKTPKKEIKKAMNRLVDFKIRLEKKI